MTFRHIKGCVTDLTSILFLSVHSAGMVKNVLAMFTILSKAVSVGICRAFWAVLAKLVGGEPRQSYSRKRNE